MSEPVKLSWMERAKETHKFHREKRLENRKWRVKDTAKSLRRSVGSISEDLLIASWMRSHRPQLEGFTHAQDALEWIRAKENQLQEEEIE